MKHNWIYAQFLKHLKICGGCVGPRKQEFCRHALPCAIAETLGKKGLVSNSKELLLYGGNSDSGNVESSATEKRDGSNNAQVYAGVGPCSEE